MTATLDKGKLRLPFAGADLIERNHSQAGQDLFVLSVLDGKRDGVFLDLGCHHPIVINNTYLLENVFGWSGLSVDIDDGFFELFVFRKSQALAADATRLDWDAVIEKLGTSTIDYLSLDLEPPETTLACLKAIPFGNVDFSVVTFEHDAYRSGDAVRNESREIFKSNGYVRVGSNVKLQELEFEDWYCNPKLVAAERMSSLKSEDQDWENVVFDRKQYGSFDDKRRAEPGAS